MPFTPFHMGPGLALKAVCGRRMSVLAFGLAQVAMDIEPLIGLLRGSAVLHGPTHTFAGAVAIGLAVAWLAPWPCRAMLALWNRALNESGLAPWESPPLARGAVAVGALLGSLSHVLLDGVMHADLHPFAPWSQSQPWRGLIGVGVLHIACVAAGALGLLVWAGRGMWRGWRELGR